MMRAAAAAILAWALRSERQTSHVNLWDIAGIYAFVGFGAGMLIKEFRPDLVVLDVMLPDINGIEVCRLVRSDKSMDDVRVICISGMVEEDKIQQLRDAGANDFLKKPFDVENLVNHICQLLDVESVPHA